MIRRTPAMSSASNGGAHAVYGMAVAGELTASRIFRAYEAKGLICDSLVEVEKRYTEHGLWDTLG